MKQQIQLDYTLDLRGESCPYPVIYTLDALEEIESGHLLQVITDCPATFRNVPEETMKHGYRMERSPVKEGQEIFFYIYA